MSFRARPTVQRPTPIVVSVPHAGLRIPSLRADLADLPRAVFFRDVDFEVPRIWQRACRELDIPMIEALDHRYALDLNRRPDQIDDSTVSSSGRPAGSEKRGLFWLSSTRQEPVLKAPLSRTTADALVREIWTPYNDWIETELAAARAKFGFALLIDGHSMPSVGTSFHEDPSAERADLVPGDVNGKSCDARVLQTAQRTAEGKGFSCRPNLPYSGGGITQRFGRPTEGLHALQIEVNRKLYMTEEHIELRLDGMARLQDWARDTLNELSRLRLA